MKNEDYIVIQGWMYGIPLTATQRVVYAIIWGFSRDGRSVFRGTAKMIAEWAGCTDRNAKYIIRQLEDLGLIDHRVVSIPKKGRRAGGVMSEFWAILPEDAQHPEKKDRIEWAGRRKVGKNVSQISLPQREADFPTPHISTTRNKYISGGGGKNKRVPARNSTTTTGFLFENEGTGLAPGEPQVLRLPFEESFFRETWAALLRQPKWSGKTPEALQIVLDRLAATGDCYIATWCCMKAIEKGWDTIKDPQAIADADWDAMIAWSNVADQKEKEVKA